MGPRHALAAAAISPISLGGWAALSTDSHKPAAQAGRPSCETGTGHSSPGVLTASRQVGDL